MTTCCLHPPRPVVEGEIQGWRLLEGLRAWKAKGGRLGWDHAKEMEEEQKRVDEDGRRSKRNRRGRRRNRKE